MFFSRGEAEDVDEDTEPTFEPHISQRKIDTESAVDFPSLVEQPASANTNGASSSQVGSSIAQNLALKSGKNVSGPGNQKATGASSSRATWNAKVTGQNKMAEEFPSLNGDDTDLRAGSHRPAPQNWKANETASGSSLGAIASKKAPGPNSGFTEEFPSLDGLSLQSNSKGVWKGQKKLRQQPRTTKVAAAPKLDRKIEVEKSDSFQFVPLSANKAKKDALLNSLTVSQNCDEPKTTAKIDKTGEMESKKKAKNKGSGSGDYNDTRKEHVKAASAVFNGGQFSTKDKSAQKYQRNEKIKNEDFPSLGPSTANKNNNPALKNGALGHVNNPTRSVPPGFSPKPNSATTNGSDSGVSGYSSVCSAPPGFSSRSEFNNNDVDLDCELKIKSATAKDSLYTQPPDFTKRGQRLFERIQNSLGSDDSPLEMFRSMMSQYRRNEIASQEFYELCRDMFGTTDLKKIFPELVALLPDIPKQQVKEQYSAGVMRQFFVHFNLNCQLQELLYAHRKAGGQMTGLSSCAECYQILNAGDMAAHIQTHSAGELFPAL